VLSQIGTAVGDALLMAWEVWWALVLGFAISAIVQAGFVVGAGILLDTFLVRTVTVPATAVLVGRANWWPSRWRPRPSPPAKRAEQVSAPDAG